MQLNGELVTNDIVRTRFVKESFAVLQQVDGMDAGGAQGRPARFAAPPVAPEVEFGTG